MNDHKTLLKEVFGESRDLDTEYCEEQCQQKQHQSVEDPSYEDGAESNVSQNPSWQRIKEIKGLCVCRDFLPPKQQSCLLSTIQNEGWFTDASHNQAMKFGDLPAWAIKLSDSIRETVFCDYDLSTNDGDKEVCLLPLDLLWREPLFDQLIVNIYQPGEGICVHVDLMRFEDGICIFWLESSCVMHFTQVKEAFATEEGGTEDSPAAKIPLYLTLGSLVLMSGELPLEASINLKPRFQTWEGKELNQKRRTSITLRKLCNVE